MNGIAYISHTENGLNYKDFKAIQCAVDTDIGITGVNGSYREASGIFAQSLPQSGLAVGIRGDLYGSVRCANMHFIRIAVYNRMLTQEELAYNYSIDAERFSS